MFDRLFKSSTEPKDRLSQAQREAIVDLLNFCMFADNLITISESKFVAGKVEDMSWDPKISFEYYQGKSIGAARAALAKPESKKAFLESIRQRLDSAEVRSRAYVLCHKIFMADGNQSAGETALQSELLKALQIGQ